MNWKRTFSLLSALFVISVVTVLTARYSHNRVSAKMQLANTHSPPSSNVIPPAPPVFAAPKRSRVANQIAPSAKATSQSVTASLLYDERLSFEQNLTRLKEFCRSHSDDQRLQQLLEPFLRTLIERAKAQFAVITGALKQVDGSAAYRNILLACLTAAAGPPSEKADIVWRTSLNREEAVETRRLATRLIPRFADDTKRSDELFSLLKDPDTTLVALALKISPFELDDRCYNLIRASLLASTDINLRIAAVDAIGCAPNADKQTDLLSIVGRQQTSKTTMFTDASLVKRRAVDHLDINDPQSQVLIKHIVLDEAEDPSVRANAISRLTATDYPDATNILLNLLRNLDANNAVMIAAIEDNLLTTPSPTIVRAIQSKAEDLSDPQLRVFMLKRLQTITKPDAK